MARPARPVLVLVLVAVAVALVLAAGCDDGGAPPGGSDAGVDAPGGDAAAAPDAATLADAPLAPSSDGPPRPDAAPPVYTNPVLDVSGDPACRRFGDAYYLYLPQQVRRDGVGVGGKVVGFTSTDLVHWSSLGAVYDNVDEAYDGERTIGLWAPEVLAHGGRYYLYYVNVMTGGADANVGNKDIVVISSDDPTDFRGGTGRKVLLDDAYAFIDPSPFEDPVSGELYLLFKHRGAWGTGSQIRIRPLAGPTVFGGTATVLLDSANVPDAGQLEHPTMTRRGDVYFLLFSKGEGDRPSYAIAYATATRPTGPVTQRGVLFESDGDLAGDVSRKVIAPGAASIVRDGAGDSWMVYRQKTTAEVTFADRAVCIDPIAITPSTRSIRGTPTKGVARPGPAPLP